METQRCVFSLTSVFLVIGFCGAMNIETLWLSKAARFIKRMEEDKPSEWLVANLQKGRELLESVNERRQELKNAK